MRYTWSDQAPGIKEIRIIAGKKALPEAQIFAPPAGLDAAAGLDALLAEKGYAISYDVIDNRPALRVSGFKDEAALLKLLQESGAVQGAPHQEKTQNEKRSFDRLTGAAIFYELGNVSSLVGSLLREDKDERDSNLAFIAGDSVMLAFGRRTTEEKQIAVMQDFGKILQRNGLTPESGSAFAAQHTENLPGTWNALRRWMGDKVIPFKAASEITAGYKRIVSGRNQNNSYKVVSGGALIAGFTSSLLLQEKTSAQLRDQFGVKTDAEVTEKIAALPFFKRVYTYLQMMPLVLSGGLAAFNNISGVAGAIDEMKYHRQVERADVELGKSDGNNGYVTDYTYTMFGFTGRAKLKDTPGIPALEAAKAAFNADASKENGAALVAAQKRFDTLEKNLLRAQKARDRKAWIFDLAQSAFFGVANFLYATAPKGGNLGDKQKLADRFFAAAASEIATASAESQHYLFGLACQFAGSRRDFGVTAQEAQTLLQEKLQMLEANPWLRARQGVESVTRSVPQPGTTKAPAQASVPEHNPTPAAPEPTTHTHSFVNALGEREGRSNILTNPLGAFSSRDYSADMGGVIAGI